MLSFEPSIIFVDDKEEQVNGIVQLYRNEGIGVKFYNADLTNGDNKPENRYSNINLIYLDLYYKEDFDIDLCLGWVDSIISENSFYILVIWSKDTQHTSEIVDGLKGLNKKPFTTFSETKNDDYKNPDNSFKWEDLKAKIDLEIATIPQLEELAIWKKSILYSSNSIIGHLTKGIESEALKKKLQKIILGHGGSYLKGSDKEIEKRETLFDALDSILVSNSKITRPNQKISEENKTSLYNIPSFPQGDIDAKLNSWFHFNLQPISSEQVLPGLICTYQNDSLKTNYNIQDDETIKKYLGFQIENMDVDENPTQLIDIALVISRPCDIAQNKFGRNLKLLSGLLIVNPIRKKNQIKGKIRTPLSLKIFEHLHFSSIEKDCTLIFDFRYSFSLPPSIFHERFEKIKLFNKELLSEIQVEYSSYSSRLGITQII
jgi:hypothetical protein